jgi:hypothetical protein
MMARMMPSFGRAGKRESLERRPGAVIGVLLLTLAPAVAAAQTADWPQWGRDPGHGGATPVVGQPLAAILAEVVYDPFVAAEEAEDRGNLLVHYAVPLADGGDVYMARKTGVYVGCPPPGSAAPIPCGPDAWDTQIWNVTKYRWQGGALAALWTFESDWKPEPNGDGGLAGWEPVFLPALAGPYLYVPGFAGTVHRVSKETGVADARLSPFTDYGGSRYVAGGLAVDPSGALVYDVMELDPSNPWGSDVVGAWLVRIAPDGTAARADFGSLVSGEPLPTDPCQTSFSRDQLPWPPSPDALPPSLPCGSQRPGVNVVPAIAPDGTIYTVSRAHRNSRYAYLVAARPDLTPAWSVSLRGILNDGCGVLVPIGTATGCRAGAHLGVDPATNDGPAGRVVDQSTASPVVLPDGAVLYGAQTSYNYSRGHFFKFDSSGSALATYDFGWDITPAVFPHDGTYSIVTKDNHYDGPDGTQRYDLSSLDAGLVPEWRLTNTSTESCARQPDGSIACVDDHPEGFEWCVNQPAVDANGVVFANSEDGFLYAIGPDGTVREKIFLNLALGAAYTPVSLGRDGRIYAQNNGRLFVIGFPVEGRAAPVRSPLSVHGTSVVSRP